MIPHKIRQFIDTNIHDATSNYKVSECVYSYPHKNYNIISAKLQQVLLKILLKFHICFYGQAEKPVHSLSAHNFPSVRLANLRLPPWKIEKEIKYFGNLSEPSPKARLGCVVGSEERDFEKFLQISQNTFYQVFYCVKDEGKSKIFMHPTLKSRRKMSVVK